MTDIPLFPTDFERQVAKESSVRMVNRFAERNPTLSEDPVAVISRPALRKFTEVGTGPIREVYSSPGVFNGDLFAVSGDFLYRISSVDLTFTNLGQISTGGISSPYMATTAPIGDTVPAYLFIAEGAVLWVYTDNGHAAGQLEATGVISNGDVVRIDTIYYQYTNASVDAGTPAGTVGNPWLVALGVSTITALTNLYNAIDTTGNPGTDYSTALDIHPTVQGTAYGPADLFVEAKLAGPLGDAIAITETGAGLAWNNATLTNGGGDQLRQVFVPDDAGAISVAHINSYIIVIPIQGDTTKGLFYWIEPGETTIDPLNFATAERNPDGLHQVVVFGDMFWLLGEDTTEPWVTTGNPVAPMQRFKGILFDRGSWEGTAIQVKDSLIVVDENGGVFQIKGGQKRISRPDIEERIRRAKQTADFAGA